MNKEIIIFIPVAQNAGNMFVLGVSGFVTSKNGEVGSAEHKTDDGES